MNVTGHVGSGPPADDSSAASFIIPTGLAAVVLSFAILFAVASIVVVSMRIMVRARAKTLGLDDGLMAVGLVLFLANATIASYATFHGLGSPGDQVGNSMRMVGTKYVTIWQLVYVVTLAFIKSSICITLLRIAVEKYHKWVLYATLTISSLVSLIGLIGILTVCHPIEAQWEMTMPAQCAPRSVVISLNYLISAGAIVTDSACAIIPTLILWNAQLETKVKVSVGVVLGLGSLASLSTLARLPYLQYYGDVDNFLYNVGFIVLWSIVEGGIGLVAGSLPMLRQLFQYWIGGTDQSTSVERRHAATIGYQTRGPSTVSMLPRHSSSLSRTNPQQQGRKWDQLHNANIHSKEVHRTHNDSAIQLNRGGWLEDV